MKKDFFEIMKNYNSEKKGELPRINKIKEKTMSKINTEKPKRNIRFSKKFIGIVAAAAIAVTTGGVVLANELGLVDSAVMFFENNRFSISRFYDGSQNIEKTDIEIISESLNPERVSTMSNGYTLELTGSMYDENVVFLFYKLTAPENVILDEDEYYLNCNKVNIKNTQSELALCSGTEYYDDNKTDNIIYFVDKYLLCGYNISNFESIEYNEIRFVNEEYWEHDFRKGEFDNLVVEGQWNITIDLKKPVCSLELFNKETNNSDNIRYSGFNTVKLSPISLYPEHETLNIKRANILMKDGSVIELDENNTENLNDVFAFSKPIELEKVKAVEINGAIFEVPHNKNNTEK